MRRVAVTLVLVSGCSFAFVHGPRPTRRDSCTTTNIPPILDTIGTVLLAGLAVAVETAPAPQTGMMAISKDTGAGLSVVAGIGTAISAAYGYSHVSACRQARTDEAVTPESTHRDIQAAIDAAAEAARAGDCSQIESTTAQLRTHEPGSVAAFEQLPEVVTCRAAACRKRRDDVAAVAARTLNEQARAQILATAPTCP